MSATREEYFIQELKSKTKDIPFLTSTPKYYGVSLPRDILPKQEHGDLPLVYEEKNEALCAIKNYKGSRLKVFSSKEEAMYFASQPAEIICASPSPSIASGIFIAEKSLSEEKSKFKSVTSQEIVKLRKAIEKGDAAYFTETVWENPRYLINSGDAPTIMHEGFRYNALHVSARHKQAVMCNLILITVQNPKFFELLYDDDTEITRANRIYHVTDLYLNTPDKGFCETPLHFASKFGCLDVLKVLLVHPLCDKDKINKYGSSAKEMACDRCPNSPPELKKEITELFEGMLYVPVLRDENNTAQPVLGKPYSPKCINSADSCILNYPEVPYPSLSVKAYAGPMSPNMATEFYRIWKNPRSPMYKTKYTLLQKNLNDIRLSDTEKGLERVGRKLASDFGINWHEYWPALEAWINLASPEGLKILEEHLRKQTDELYKEELKMLISQEPKELDKVPCDGNAIQNIKKNKFSPPIYALLSEKLHIHDKDEETTIPVKEDFNIQENETSDHKIINTEFFNLNYPNTQIDSDQEVKRQLYEIIVKDILENFCDFTAHLLSNSMCNENKNISLIFNKLIPIFKHMTQLNFSSESEAHLIHYNLAVLFHINLRTSYDEFNLVKLINFLKTFLFSSPGANIFLLDTLGQDAKEWQHLLCVLQYFYYYATNRLFEAKLCSCEWRHDSECDCYSASMCCNVIIEHQKLQQAENFEKLSDVPLEVKDYNVEDDCFYTPPESPIPDEILDYVEQSYEEFITPVSSAPPSPKHESEYAYEMLEVFVQGSECTKHDIDMYRAIEILEISSETYPHVFKWKNLIGTRVELLEKSHSYMMQEENTTPKTSDVSMNQRSEKVLNLRRNLF